MLAESKDVSSSAVAIVNPFGGDSSQPDACVQDGGQKLGPRALNALTRSRVHIMCGATPTKICLKYNRSRARSTMLGNAMRPVSGRNFRTTLAGRLAGKHRSRHRHAHSAHSTAHKLLSISTSTEHPVRDLILQRAADHSLPGRRNDSARLALCIEGGAMRGVV